MAPSYEGTVGAKQGHNHSSFTISSFQTASKTVGSLYYAFKHLKHKLNHHKTKLNVVSLQGNHEQGFASDFGFSEMKMGVVVSHC
ncbi:unnamed protein product [Prunus armeniaca]|uniref:Uncharacterized protein n=1 Tax=Prunus armeniaca TaxID=36596 RepID=A0A6J5UC36_PRUAR|nr:unnamed protein product [Prunus armeniaca]